VDIGLLSASADCFQGPPAVESDVLNVLLDHVIVCPVSTVCHIPCSVRPQLAHILNVEFQKSCSLLFCKRQCTTTIGAMLLAPFFWTVYIPGLCLIESRFCGLLCGMISRALSLVESLPVMTSIILRLCIGHVRVV